MLSKTPDERNLSYAEKVHASTYGRRYFSEPVPKFRIPDNSIPPEAAYRLIHDELNLDGNPSLNLASFVTTWMEPEADKLYLEAINKNFIDQDEYPRTKKIHDRVISMIARLFNAPGDCNPVGTATIGSSEAIMLALLAHKWSWRERMKAAGKPTDNPNIVMGADVHTCWEKFAKYFDVEARVVPLRPDSFILKAEDVYERIDENTIAVGAILGTTFTGQVDDIEEINNLLMKVKEEKGWDIPLHVDGASGGFIAPFVYPGMKWDFRLPRVKSINVSNHKFGLVYPGMGTVVFRDESDLPPDLTFHINYLGGEMPNYSLNFSRGSATIILQYYNFLRLGMSGYRDIMANIMKNADYLGKTLVSTGYFDVLNRGNFLPIVVVKLKKEENFTVFDLSKELKKRGWIVPAYTLPPNAQEIAVLRMVVKENFSRDLAEMLAADVKEAVKDLIALKPSLDSSYPDNSPHRVC